MSRGGGGFRGGRGGRGGFGGGKQMIGGQEVSWDFDPDLVIETKPQEMFPEIPLPKPRLASKTERAAVERYRAVRRRIHEGPLYTVLGDSVRVGKASAKRAAEFNPFEDMPTYTQKYKPPSRKLPKFDTRKYQLQFFPQELWATIDPIRHGNSTEAVAARPKKAGGPRRPILDDLEDEKEKVDEDDDAPKADDDEEQEEENPDENFSDDDDDMGEDYDAERYFDGGDDDAGDAVDGDGGDDGGDY